MVFVKSKRLITIRIEKNNSTILSTDGFNIGTYFSLNLK